MPGVYRFSLDLLEQEIREITSLGIPSIMLFGLPDHKDAEGTSAYDPNGIVQEATRLIKKWAPELVVMADTCLCQFTDHGHCGMVHQDEVTGTAVVDNDSSLSPPFARLYRKQRLELMLLLHQHDGWLCCGDPRRT